MRHASLCLLLCAALAGCCLSTSVNGQSTGGGETGSSGGSAGASGSSTASGSTTSPPPSTGCWPGTIWVGDECVALNCANFGGLPCQFSDGGLGNCQAGGCYALGSDPNNCGVIGSSCPPLTACIQGYCEYGDGGLVACEPPLTSDGFGHCIQQTCTDETDNVACGTVQFCCHGACIVGDAQDCGGCGLTCGEGSICWLDGQARHGASCAPPATCPATPLSNPQSAPICQRADGLPGLCCGDACVDQSSDPTNCSFCGRACPPGATCSNGSCSVTCASDADCSAGFECELNGPTYLQPGYCIPKTCSASLDGDFCTTDNGATIGTCCGGSCVAFDLSCGYPSCHVCDPDQICDGFACISSRACGPGDSASIPHSQVCAIDAGTSGTCCGTACVDIGTDLFNCGECGRACNAGGSCTNGNCQEGCSPGAPCPDGYACEDGQCIKQGCDGTNEVCSTSDGESFCLGEQCFAGTDGGFCLTPSSTCPPGSTCETGRCLLPDGGGACGRDFYFQPSTRDDCPPGTMCTAAQACQPILDCSPDSQVPGAGGCLHGPNDGASCCGGSCVNTELDPQNCGNCGNACASGICVGYVESFPPYGCLPTGPSDDCSPSCGPGTVCVNAACVGSACGYNADSFCLDQDQTIGFCCGTGVCAHLPDDPENCGLCGNKCPAGETCANGTCSGVPECPPENMLGFCNLDAGVTYACCLGSGCTNLLTDSANCGFCGRPCPSAAVCAAGVCVSPTASQQ